ncbi:MAG TPA: redoxin family protein, partial [Pirellulales bacterium]|nr:redoxin family protein [Pirellulales bacterium]
MRQVIAASVALLLLSIAGRAHAERKIRFPDEAVGSVLIQPQATVDFGYETWGGATREGWQDHGPAAGEVAIPDGFAVMLELNPTAASDPSWLDDLPADAIDILRADRVPLGDEGFARLSRLVGLRHLSIVDAGLTSAVANHLPRLRHLRYLWLAANADVRDDAMAAVAALPELQTVGLRFTGVTDAGLESLSKSKSIQAIYALNTRITDAGLAAVTRLRDLRALSVYADGYTHDLQFRGKDPNPSITDAGLAHLANCRNLEQLDVRGSELTDTGLERLVADCPHLRELMVDNTPVTTKGLRCLGSLSQLERLGCYGTPIDDSVVEHFGSLDKLREIIGDVRVGNAGAENLAALPSLERLPLWGKCDDRCMASVAAMRSLKDLSIQNTRITDEGFALLAGSPTIERVQITGSRMTTRCLETLATMPRLKRVGLLNVDPKADGEPIWKGLENLQSLDWELSLWDCPPLAKDDFAKLAGFQNLVQLRIGGLQPITDADLQHLCALKKLKFLELASSIATDEGLELLGSLPNLETLRISCLATEKGLEALGRSPRLVRLKIGSPYLTDEKAKQFHGAHPRLAYVQFTEFLLGRCQVSRAKANSDVFWREGREDEREHLNSLEGKPPPALTVTDWMNAGDATTLDSFRGKVVLIDFWGTWCGACLARMPELRRLHETYAASGLVIIGLHTTQGAEGAAAYVAENHIPWPVGLDNNTQSAAAYAVPHYPSFFLIDRTGVLRMANPYEGQL